MLLGLVGVLVGVAWLSRPADPLTLDAVPGQPRLWRGAYHVHSTHSDGSGSPDAIARAAADAGLDFVVLTDHGDATRAADPPRYVDGVLLIDAVEISTDDGHYVAIGMAAAPYPLAGEGRAVAEDVRRYGGIGIIAHPDSPRAALAWHDPSTDADGFEWVNADSTWRGASAGHLLARLATYPFARAGTLTSLATYPAALFAARDTPAHGATLALAAVDAHARIGWTRQEDPIEGGVTLARFPSYRAMFGTFGLVVPWAAGPPSGDASRDADAVIGHLRTGSAYTGVFSMATAPWLSLTLDDGTPSSRGATLVVRSNAPSGALLRVRRNGLPWQESSGPDATFDTGGDTPAIYRAELWLPHRRGWPDIPVAISQAVAHGLPPAAQTPGEPDVVAPLAATSWHGEHDARSTVALHAARQDVAASATLTLASGPRVSQFAALVADIGPPPAGANALRLVLEADAPMRLSVQWREPSPGEGLRWRHSTWVGPGGVVAVLPLDAFRPIAPASGRVPLDRVHALLLVMDTVNARPGDRRTITVREAQWVRAR